MNKEKFLLGVDKDMPLALLTYEECCIRTFTGKMLNVFEPRLEDITIEDIAHGLSMECRFGRQLPKFYSVAQHSILAAGMVDPEYGLAALLHDASEAYLGDMPSPIKKRLPDYKKAEAAIMKAIAKKFGFEYPLNKQVKEADYQLLVLEYDCLTVYATEVFPVPVLTMEEAEQRFLETFYKLYK